MRARGALDVAAAAMSVAAIGLWLWCNHTRGRHEHVRRELEHEFAALSSRAGIARKQAADRTVPITSNVGPTGARTTSAKAPRAFSAESRLQDNPSLQSAYFSGKRAGVPAAYGPLIRALHLSADQAAHLAQLIADREERVFDAAAASPKLYRAMTSFDGSDHARLVIDPYDAESYSAGRVQPVSSATGLDAAAAAVVQQSADAFRDAAAQLLGSDGYAQLEAYERVLPVQLTARELAADLALTPEPLTVAQADRLVQLLADATPTYQAGGDAIPQWINWDQVAAGVPGLLSPAQLANLQSTLEYRQASQHENELQRQFFKGRL